MGEFDTVSRTYTSVRDKSKGEIFLKKQWFNGKFYQTPVAIDLTILHRLLKMRCERIDLLILHHKERAYMVSFTPEEILSKGTEINYDKITPEGKNITNYNIQIVFDLEQGKPFEQDTLDNF